MDKMNKGDDFLKLRDKVEGIIDHTIKAHYADRR